MKVVIKYARSVVVVMTNIFLLCGAGYILDWAGHVIRRNINTQGGFRRLLKVYRQQINAIKPKVKHP
jgi:hypothetical protein